MQSPATCLQLSSSEGRRLADAAFSRRRVVGVIALLTLTSLVSGLVGCATTSQSPLLLDPQEAARLRLSIEAGIELYEAGDYVLSAQRFRSAADRARKFQDAVVERRASTAECTAWLRAQRAGEFGTCTERLEVLHRRSRRSDPGLNALLVMGAVAGKRPIPPFRVPSAVRHDLRAIAKEMR